MCCSASVYHPKGISRLFVRVGFGLALAFVGFAHYQNPFYAESVARGLGVLEPVGMAWGYVLPALMILGGLLLAFGIYMNVAAYASALALASIPAGLLLKSVISGIPLESTMPPAMNALVWIIVLLMVTKGSSCGKASSCVADGCGCGQACGAAAATPVKSAPFTPTATVKAMPKKAVPAKKSSKK